jgi:hypothetical protein
MSKNDSSSLALLYCVKCSSTVWSPELSWERRKYHNGGEGSVWLYYYYFQIISVWHIGDKILIKEEKFYYY